MLLSEANADGFYEALQQLPDHTQNLIREVLTRRNNIESRQGHRGSPASDINALYPTVLFLILNGLSANEAWTLIQDKIPGRDSKNANRQLNRARSEIEKTLHTASSSIVAGNPSRFRTAYKNLQKLLE